MKEEGKQQEEELEWDLESMEPKRPYPGIKLLYWEYGTPGNIREKQEPQEDQESQPPRWEDCDARNSGTNGFACRDDKSSVQWPQLLIPDNLLGVMVFS